MTSSLHQPPPAINRNDCVYTACFCEENVYCLLQNQLSSSKGRGDWLWFAIFVSNDEQAVAIHHQRPGTGIDSMVVWDYHVVAVALPKSRTTLINKCPSQRSMQHAWVYDFDTMLPFPCPFDDYVAKALAPKVDTPLLVPPHLKWVPAIDYLASFSSDRSHMQDADGTWLASPPPYAPIVRGGNTLARFIDSTDDKEHPVLSVNMLLEALCLERHG
eukprot:m.14900 g.14900  ORF g.14900 m.14900 type:complete len:216 (-) comp10371_c0_seq1:112-759(-)